MVILTGCLSNAADSATPAPTNLTGIYKAGFFGGSITWEIFEDGTGIACEQRVSMDEDTKLRDLVVNGSKAYDVFEFEISKVTRQGFHAEGVSDLDFKRISKLPISCKY